MIERDLAFFRATRARTQGLVRCLEQEQFDYAAGAGRWSVGEVVDHMLRAEAFNRGDIARLIALAEAGERAYLRQTLEVVNISIFAIPKPVFALFETPLNFFGRFLPAGAREYATLSRLVKLKNPDNVTPRRCRRGDDLRRDLRTSFDETSELLRSHPDLPYDEMIFDQPLLGTMNVPELVRWMALHEQRHQQQLCEVLTDSGFPARL